MLDEANMILSSKFSDNQLELLERINPTSSTGVALRVCKNHHDSFCQEKWWLRANLVSEVPDFGPSLKGCETSVMSIRDTQDAQKIVYSLRAFSFALRNEI